jgi:hypothetical protein
MELENKANIFSCIYFSPEISNETIEKLKNDPVVDVLEYREYDEGDTEFTLGHSLGNFKVIADDDAAIRILIIAKANNAKVDIMVPMVDSPALNHLYYYLEKENGFSKEELDIIRRNPIAKVKGLSRINLNDRKEGTLFNLDTALGNIDVVSRSVGVSRKLACGYVDDSDIDLFEYIGICIPEFVM